MKNKIILGLFAAALFYSCTTQKTVVEDKKAEVIAEVKAVSPTVAEGKSLYEANCAKCHKLYDSKDFTAEEWTPIVMRMQKKARITDEQRDKIYTYLTTP